MSCQIYGSFSGFDSFANVSRAVAKVLNRHMVDATVYSTERFNVRYLDVPYDVAMNSRADVGIFIGYPPTSRGWLHGHEKSILITVCEASPIPREWVEIVNRVSLVVVPSAFCQDAFRTSGVHVPIMVCPHGVEQELLQAPRTTRAAHERIDLLHVSEAGSFPWRKGTSQLITAFRRVSSRFPSAHLCIKSNTLQLKNVLKETDRIWQFQPKPQLYPRGMVSFYRRFDATVQPSCGEGFGLVPLEARCLGVPAVLTNATGHREHFETGVDIPVAVGPARHMSTQWNESGACPTVSVEAVEDALVALLTALPGHKGRAAVWAARNAPRWSWQRVLHPLVRAVQRLGGTGRIMDLNEETGLRGF